MLLLPGQNSLNYHDEKRYSSGPILLEATLLQEHALTPRLP